MVDQPKVSIVVPIYGVEKYLRQCVDSILNQTLKSWNKIQPIQAELKIISYSFATRYISPNSIQNLSTTFSEANLGDAYSELYQVLSKSNSCENVPIVVLVSSGTTNNYLSTKIKLQKLSKLNIFLQSEKLAILCSNFGQSNFDLLTDFTQNKNKIFKNTDEEFLSNLVLKCLKQDKKLKTIKGVVQKLSLNTKRVAKC